MNQVPLFQFAGSAKLVLFSIAVCTIVGVILAVRGFWGTSRKARRYAILAMALTLPLGFICGSVVLMKGYQQISMLGPAATQRDEAYVWGTALGPAVASVVALVILILVAGIGWARERASNEAEPPPRKPSA